MALTQAALLQRLDAAGIAYAVHEHDAVLTIEAQVQALSGQPGTPLINLFLKDKKDRLYVISALPSTKIDLRVLSARLGLGKGGIRLAPEELLGQVLQVALGSVTPLALLNATASAVILLLDHKILAQQLVYVHPLVNTASLALTPGALAAAVQLSGKEAVYVDLEADPKIDGQNPPDLKKHVPEVEKAEKREAPAPVPVAAAAAAAAAPVASSSAPAAPSAAPKAAASKAAAKPNAAAANYLMHAELTNTTARTDALVDKVASLLLGKPLAQAQLDAYAVTRLKADVEMELNALKNAAFAMGYTAAKGSIVGHVEKRYA